MSYKLVIVESPTKVTSLSRFLDVKSDYKVMSSMGHVRDLPRKGGLNVDIENNFKPNYQVSPDKQKIVRELKKVAKNASDIIMASDEDREGEAIAWHLCHILKLDPKTTKRIVFHEITAEALNKALSEPRHINQDLVNAQQARRILDRLVGFQLSPVLWKKVRPKLSAGRVQSVAVRLIHEKEQEITDFKPELRCPLTVSLKIGGQTAIAKLANDLADLEQGREFLEDLKQAKLTIQNIKVKQSLKNPPAPLKTSTLQQEAFTRLGSSVNKTMRNAQSLYEKGLISYMRTDSLNLSKQALTQAKKQIIKRFGTEFYRHKQYRARSKSAQEAHEAIRPTDLSLSKPAQLSPQEESLYRLIYRRTLASQMSPAQFDVTDISVAISNRKEVLKVSGRVLRFAGWLQISPDSTENKLLPACKVNDQVELLEANVIEKLSKPPARYNEASLVRRLEELGIGRPSTYAPTISTIQKREYVIKGNVEPQIKSCNGLILQNGRIHEEISEDRWGGANNKLLPTHLATLVTPFLMKHFNEIMDYDFTSKLEADFDKIAVGELDWVQQLEKFYKRFQRVIQAAENVSRQEISKMREVGLDPISGRMIYARLGRHGPMLQKGEVQDEEKPLFSPLPKATTLDNVTLEQALEMFELPKTIGQNKEGTDIVIKNGPFGAYVEAGKLRAPLKDLDPFKLTLEQALELIEAKQEAEKKKLIADFGKVQIINGPYGPYITDGKKNAKIPKEEQDKDLSKISKQQALQWLEEGGKPRRKKGYRKPVK